MGRPSEIAADLRRIACVLDAASWTVEDAGAPKGDAASLRRDVVRLMDYADELCAMDGDGGAR